MTLIAARLVRQGNIRRGPVAPALCGGKDGYQQIYGKSPRGGERGADDCPPAWGHQETDAEHLALALVQQEKGIVPRILEHMGVQPRALAVALETSLRKRPSVSGSGMDPTKIMITPRLAKVLGEAQNEARRMKDEYVSVDHLFAALTEVEPGSPLGQIFKEYKITRAGFVKAMEELRGGARITSANPRIPSRP